MFGAQRSERNDIHRSRNKAVYGKLRNIITALTLSVCVASPVTLHAQWTHLGPSGHLLGDLSLHGDSLVAYYDAFTLVSHNGGLTFDTMPQLYDVANGDSLYFFGRQTAPSDFAVWYAGFTDRNNTRIFGVLRSTDAGDSWSVQCRFDTGSFRLNITQLFIHVSWANPDVIYAVVGPRSDRLRTLIISRDGGKSWTSVDFAFDDVFIGPRITFAQDKKDSSLLFVHDDGTFNNYSLFYTSSDAGFTWQSTRFMQTAALPNKMFSGFPHAGDLYFLTADSKTIYHTSDAGAKWDTVDEELVSNKQPPVRIQDYTIDPVDFRLRFAILFVDSTREARIVLHDSTSWHTIPTPDVVPAGRMWWDHDNSNLWVGTESGLWRWHMTPLAVGAREARLPTALALSPLYPNPTSATATAVVRLNEPSSLTIEAIDVAGCIVASTRTGTISKGESVVQLDLHSLSPGRYLTRATAKGASYGMWITIVH